MLARWHQLVASVIALDPLHWVMLAVWYLRTTMAIEMANKNGTFFYCCFVCCALSAAGAMQREYSPDGRIQWLPE